MPRRAILHIGPMKTGTTSIQRWLRRNAPAHAANGFFVPAASGSNLSHLGLVARARRRRRSLPTALTEWLDGLLREIAERPAAALTVVLSGEMMGQTLRDQKDVAALRSLLDPLFDEYRVITYLRRQDQLTVSRLSTALRQGDRGRAPLAASVDYEAMLRTWTAAFGRDAMCVRLFDRAGLEGGDVVRDFASAAGMPWVAEDGAGAAERNVSLTPPAQWLLGELSDRVPRAKRSPAFGDLPGMDRLTATLNRSYAGRGALPPRGDAIAFFEGFRGANERIRREWFPDREALFDEDFSFYPESGTPEPSQGDKLEVALVALVAALTAPEPDERREPSRKVWNAEAKKRREERRRSKRG